jgi:hypothetical protein
VAGGAFVATTADGVDAGPRTKSEVVAAEADRALDALDSWEATHNPADYVRFVRARDAAASITAAELEIEADRLGGDWVATTSEKQRAVLAALSQLGVPYQSLESQPGVGFDCSGLTIWAFDQAGLEIPRNSRDQFRASNEVDLGEAEVGDLVYYPGHVGIYLGADLMVHSPETGSHVEVVGLPTKHSLRYGDLVDALLPAEASSDVEPLSTLVDRATAVSQ